MQFVPGGPEIPNSLLQAHEEGRVVFFCGAGISYPARLPGFEGLVKKIYKHLGTSFDPLEKIAFEKRQYDTVLGLLERRIDGDLIQQSRKSLEVRKSLARSLTPDLRRKGAIETHTALLRLAKCRTDNKMRIVTTNFDRLFDIAAKRTKQVFESFTAPMLPIPKNSRWNGLVYLHGRLPEKHDEASLNRLVVTSGDFGLAYLVERWAARFVSELLRNYEVCFVGYSINDPVLRYMMDALAADRMMGESLPNAWAFGDCEPGKEGEKTDEWSSKGVSPILYSVEKGSTDHSMLHGTLHNWSETYRDGVNGKERIIVKYASAQPGASTKQDDYAGQVLWAITDKSGLPAKRFAEINPAPSLDWLLGVFGTRIFENKDLSRFGVKPIDEFNNKFSFTLTHRPAPYHFSPSMSFANRGQFDSGWDNIIFYLADWLARHLNDPLLVLWIASRGGQIHELFARTVDRELNKIHGLEREGNVTVLERIRTESPNAIPSRMMRTLWGMIVNGRLKSPERDLDLYHWKNRFIRDGLTTSLRQELREILSPKVAIRGLPMWNRQTDVDKEPIRLKQIVDWELVLNAEESSSILLDIADDRWKAAIPSLLPDFQQLLRDALDMLREFGEADDKQDRSFMELPSVEPHQQNSRFQELGTLIELVRDSWIEFRKTDVERSNRIAQDWFETPYAAFKRLAFFAACRNDCISPEQWVQWLLIDDAWWLWSEETRREVLRLLVLQGSNLEEKAQSLLESAIRKGPPRKKCRDDLEPQRWQNLLEHSIWLRLAKLKSSGIQLGAAAQERLDELSKENPLWQLAHDERDEFSIWKSGTGDPDFEEYREIDIIPTKRKDIVLELVKKDRGNYKQNEDNWRDVCKKHLLNSLSALKDLGEKEIWTARRWSSALNAWSEKERLAWWSWRYGASATNDMPEAVFTEIIRDVSRWLEVISKSIDREIDQFLILCRRVLDSPISADSGMTQNGKPIDQPVTEAINHPVGDVTQALVNLWFARKPNDNDGLPNDLEPFFTKLCDVGIDRFRHGRVLLATRSVALFRVDKKWTKTHILPLFDWNADPSEAKGAWDGFLWSLLLYQPLMIALKSQFLECSRHYVEIGERRDQFAALMTHAALGPIEGYTYKEFRQAFESLPQEGLEASARALVIALDSAADQRQEFWKNRVQPFWHNVWPKSRKLITSGIVLSLLRLTIAAGSSFPHALNTLETFLYPIEDADLVVHELKGTDLCSKFPTDALRLLSLAIDERHRPIRDLRDCLNTITNASPELRNDSRFERLNNNS